MCIADCVRVFIRRRSDVSEICGSRDKRVDLSTRLRCTHSTIDVKRPVNRCDFVICLALYSSRLLYFFHASTTQFAGGQMKTKNGQKYVINSNRSGVYVPRYCIILTALLGLLAMIVIALLSYFLLSQTR